MHGQIFILIIVYSNWLAQQFQAAYIDIEKIDDDECNDNALRYCFETAFLQTKLLRQQMLQRSSNRTLKVWKRNWSTTRVAIQCTQNQLFLSCFESSKCRQIHSAKIASTAYQQIFGGPPQPLHAFIAMKGYLTKSCSSSCSLEDRRRCKYRMSHADVEEEHAIYRRLTSLSKRIDNVANNDDCAAFELTLNNLIRLRRHVCGEGPKCSCNDENFHTGITNCKTVCSLLQTPRAYAEPNSSTKCSKETYLPIAIFLTFSLVQFFR